MVTLNREVTLPFEEIIRRGMAIYEGEDVARMNYELHALAMEARYKDQSGVEKLLLDHITQQNRSDERPMDKRERRSVSSDSWTAASCLHRVVLR